MDSTDISFSHLSSRLKELSFDNLPGVEAQIKMAPAIRETDIRLMGAGKNPIPSAVMLLFYPDTNGLTSLVLIKRTDYGGAHSGQVSFPGGRYDATDESLAKTALRETHEEIGVAQSQVEIVGKLTDLYIPPTNFTVSPFLALSARTPVFSPNCREVASLIEVRVSELFNPSNIGMEIIRLHNGMMLETPCYFLNGHVVWGATAMIISELAEYLQGNTIG